jgi:hypothetical protein
MNHKNILLLKRIPSNGLAALKVYFINYLLDSFTTISDNELSHFFFLINREVKKITIHFWVNQQIHHQLIYANSTQNHYNS